MAEIIPMIVNNCEELAGAVKLERTAILVKNKEMYDSLAAREKRSLRKKKASNVGKGASVVAGVGSVVAAILGPVGIFAACTYILTASILTLGGSALAGISKSDLDKYRIAFYEDKEILVLLKVKGVNAARKDDTVRIPDDL